MKRILNLLMLFIVVGIIFNFTNVSAAVLELKTGTYTSSDGHSIVINPDKTVKYDDTYSLTLTEKDRGSVITGKIGNNNKAVTLYQLNDSKIVAGNGNITYKHSGANTYLYAYTVFSIESTPTVLENSGIELYRNGTKVNSYADFQSAVDAANSGDTIKITKDISATMGAFIDKNLTIEGNNKIIHRETWANSLFVVDENVTLTINNLTIDGGADGFEIDYSLSYPKLKEGTLDGAQILNEATVISKGVINTNKVLFSNLYTTTNYASAVRIVRGSGNIKNTDFIHNYGKTGGMALSVFSDFKDGETIRPITNVIVENSKFIDNFTVSGNGGAVFAYNVDNIKFTNCEFTRNMASAYTAGGGAVLIYRSGVKPAETNNLPYTQAYFDNCIFEENYSGNDGYAIQNESAELYITNCEFNRNVGLSSGSSVGTVSCMADTAKKYTVLIKDSSFDGNVMGASVFGDHGTLVDLEMTNVEIKNNTGSMSILLYSANAKFNNVTFENETVKTTVLDVRPYVSETTYPAYKPQNVYLNEVEFINTDGPTDILIRRRNHNMSYNDATVIIQDNVIGNVDVWDNNNLVVEGTLDGNVKTDGTTEKEKVVIKENGEVTGKTTYNEGKVTITLNYPNGDGSSYMFLYLEKDKTYTEKELYMMHLIGADDKKLSYYTAADMTETTAWDLKPTANATIYSKFVDHNHTFSGNLDAHGHGIYETCDLCGYFGKKLEIDIKEEIFDNEANKAAKTINELNINSNDYTISYMKRNNDGTWSNHEGVPTRIGQYKVVLTYNNLVAEKIYAIAEGPIEIPNTFDKIGNMICMLILGLFGLGTVIRVYSKVKVNN